MYFVDYLLKITLIPISILLSTYNVEEVFKQKMCFDTRGGVDPLSGRRHTGIKGWQETSLERVVKSPDEGGPFMVTIQLKLPTKTR